MDDDARAISPLLLPRAGCMSGMCFRLAYAMPRPRLRLTVVLPDKVRDASGVFRRCGRVWQNCIRVH